MRVLAQLAGQCISNVCTRGVIPWNRISPAFFHLRTGECPSDRRERVERFLGVDREQLHPWHHQDESWNDIMQTGQILMRLDQTQ